MNPGYCTSAVRVQNILTPPCSFLTHAFSKLHRNVPRAFAILEYIFTWVFARSTEVGSRTLVHAALWGTKDDVNGRFLSECQVMEESDYSISKEGKEVEARLWVSFSSLVGAGT